MSGRSDAHLLTCMNDNVVAFVSRWRGRYHRRFVVGSCPAARCRQWAWESFPLRRRQFHRYRPVAADSSRIRRPDAFAHRRAAASGNARSKTARSRYRTQTEIEAGPSLASRLVLPHISAIWPASRPGPWRAQSAPLPAVLPWGGRQFRSTSRHSRTTGPP